MAQVVVYLAMDTEPSNADDAVIGNGAVVPTITGTHNVALTYDVATINIDQLQRAVSVLDQFASQYANGANAAGTTYSPTATQ